MFVFFGLASVAVAALAYVFGDETSTKSVDVAPVEGAIEKARNEPVHSRRGWQLLSRALTVIGSAVVQVWRAAWPRVKELVTNWVVARVETHFAPSLPP